MPFFTWTNEYSVGVKSIDIQHTNLFEIINDLHYAMKSGQAERVIEALLRKLFRYTESHFAAEEQLMRSTGYAHFEKHRAIHVALTRKVREFLGKLEKGGSALNVELLVFLCDWLQTHILQQDKAYSPWVKAHGAV